MAKGTPGAFACALNYEAAVEDGITEMDFFEKEKARMPASVFSMEYDSIFLGSTSNSAFPYELTEGCRTLEKVELSQPKNTHSRYVISLDIATSEASTADNSILSVVKFTEKTDGSYSYKLVNLRSFHGKGLDVLSEEVRKLYHLQFPNAERIIYDARGLGDSFSKFLDDTWTDPATGKEYPPLVHDDERMPVPGALPILHAVRAIQALNQQMATRLRVLLEKRKIELPTNSRIIQSKRADAETNAHVSTPELAIFLETDALQFEMGNIVCKVSGSGNYIYDTPRITLHKDRYSSLAMACDYIYDLEEASIKKKQHGPVCIGFATGF